MIWGLLLPVANKFVTEYGCLRLSIGEAIRRVMSQFPESDLTAEMKSYLQIGQTLPDELCILALERALMDIQCTTRGSDPCVVNCTLTLHVTAF